MGRLGNGGGGVKDLEMMNKEINRIANEAANLIFDRSQGNRLVQVAAAMGSLMALSRHYGLPDADIVASLQAMYDNHPRVHDA